MIFSIAIFLVTLFWGGRVETSVAANRPVNVGSEVWDAKSFVISSSIETSLILLGFESPSRGITSKMAVMEEQNKMDCPICLMSNVIDMQQGGLF